MYLIDGTVTPIFSNAKIGTMNWYYEVPIHSTKKKEERGWGRIVFRMSIVFTIQVPVLLTMYV